MFDLNGIKFENKLNYAQSKNNNVHVSGTAIGGLVSLFLVVVSILQGVVLFQDVINKFGMVVDTNTLRISAADLVNTKIKFGDNFKGMNVFINYENSDKKFDPLNNQYYQIKVYVSTNPDTQKAEEIIDGSAKLIRCPNEEVKKYF